MMIKLGYKLTREILAPVVECGDDAEAVCAYIKRLNEKSGVREMRVTGDMLVTNINKVVSKLAKNKIDS